MTTHQSSSSKEECSNSSSSAAARRGTLLTMALRILSFVCTQVSFTFVSPEILGLAHVQLELMHSTILFTSREGFRLSLVKATHWDSFLANLVIPVHILVALIGHFIMMALHTGTLFAFIGRDDFQMACALFATSAIVEGMAEPSILHSLHRLDVSHKASAEGTAILVKTFTTVILLMRLQGLPPQDQYPISCFGLAQLAYAFAYAVVAIFIYPSRTNNKPTQQNQQQQKEQQSSRGHLIYLIFVFTLQGMLKHVLTEADRIVLASLAGSYDQGLYVIASSYGGMIVRMLLQPLEENARLLFSRQVQQLPQPKQNTTSGGKKQQQEEQQSFVALYETYICLVKLVLYIGFLFACFASHYTTPLLLLKEVALGGGGKSKSSSSSAGAVSPILSMYCRYILSLAWNGMAEAFLYGTISNAKHIYQLSLMHGVVGVVFWLGIRPVVSRHQTQGLLAMNTFCMLLRALCATYMATTLSVTTTQSDAQDNNTDRKQGEELQSMPLLIQPVNAQIDEKQEDKMEQSEVSRLSTIGLLRTVFPPLPILIALVVSNFVMMWSDQVYTVASTTSDDLLVWNTRAVVQHVGVGISCLMGVASLVYYTESSFGRLLQKLLFSRASST